VNSDDTAESGSPNGTRIPVIVGPCIVGLTGGLASGKSTVASILADRGVPIFDADRAVHALYEAGCAGSIAVEALFGGDVLDQRGGVDRDALAARVLGQTSERRLLEAAIHPLVRQAVREWTAALDPHPVAVVEAALLIETGSYRDYDVLLVVWCHLHQQLQRALVRGVPAERARKLIHAQMALDDKRDLADVVIDNSGTEDQLEIEIDRAWSRITAACGGQKPSAEDEGESSSVPWGDRRQRS